ncbi:MAG: hypothetical protein R2749_15315 [Acidimicrobiales bacterium]
MIMFGTRVHHQPVERAGAFLPAIGQLHAVHAGDVDAVVAAGDGIEPGGVHDDVELELAIARLDPGLGDALERGLAS